MSGNAIFHKKSPSQKSRPLVFLIDPRMAKEKGVLEPYLVIRVSEAPSAVGASLGYAPYSVGEALVSLEDRRPCCASEMGTG